MKDVGGLMLIADAEQGQALGFQIGVQASKSKAVRGEITLDE